MSASSDANDAGPAAGAGSFSQPDPALASFTNSFYAKDGSSPDAMAESASLPALDGEEGGGDDRFTETTSVSWFDKLAEAAVGVLVGLALILITGFLLFWNEGRAVQTYRSLNEGSGQVVDVGSDRVDPANDGKLVHVQGDLAAATPVVDGALGMQARAARLVRTVEMYQWKEESHTETHKRVGGGEDRTTTYTYSRIWSDSRNNSDRFRNQNGHQNPQMRYGRFEASATDATLGGFRPTAAALGRLPAERVEPVDEATVSRLRARGGGIGPVQASDGIMYLGSDPADPRIGDHRVTYRVAPLGPVTFVGRQSGQDLQEFQTQAGDRLLMAQAGLVPASSMFAQAQADNRVLTWILRIVGVVLMWVGFFLVFRPIAVVGDLVPFIGSILAVGAGIAAAALTAVTAPVIIAIAWLFYRPLLAAALLAGAAAIVYGIRVLAQKRRDGRMAGGAGGMNPRPA